MIGIIDYGAGNLRSVKLALDFLGLPGKIVRTPGDLGGMTGMILPGVGHFRSAMKHLRESGLHPLISEWLAAGKPFLGICLGMQLLYETSEEGEGAASGFAVLPGNVVRFRAKKNLHMGWNLIRNLKCHPLFSGLADGEYFYFVHRYYAAHENPDFTLATCEFGAGFPAAVAAGAICGVQFHPEKSGPAGLRLLENWGRSC